MLQEPVPGLEREPGWAAAPVSGSSWELDLESLDVGRVRPLAFGVQGPGSCRGGSVAQGSRSWDVAGPERDGMLGEDPEGRGLVENVLCMPFLFLQILGTFLRSEQLCTAVQVWAEV